MEGKPREHLPDLVKGHAIFGVALIHCGSYVVVAKDPFLAESHYFRFGVPLFLVIWAYFLENKLKINSDSLANDFKRVGRIFPSYFIPFLAWSGLYFLLTGDFHHMTIKSFITRHFSGFGWSGQYFFIIIFQLLFLFPFLRRIKLTWLGFLPVVIFYSILYFFSTYYLSQNELFWKIGDRPFFYWLPYPLLGILVSRIGEPQLVVAWRSIWVIALFPLLIVLEMHFLPHRLLSQVDDYLLPSTLIASLGIGCFLRHNSEMLNISYRRFMCWLGAHSLAIFCLNPLIPLLAGQYLIIFSRKMYIPVLSDILAPFAFNYSRVHNLHRDGTHPQEDSLRNACGSTLILSWSKAFSLSKILI
jgi:hypothetical protein